MLFEGHVSASSLSEICIFFPDPWPNIPRDLQRRVVRGHILDLFAASLRPHGLLRVATDVQEYSGHVRDTVQQWNHDIARQVRSAWYLLNINTYLHDFMHLRIRDLRIIQYIYTLHIRACIHVMKALSSPFLWKPS